VTFACAWPGYREHVAEELVEIVRSLAGAVAVVVERFERAHQYWNPTSAGFG